MGEAFQFLDVNGSAEDDEIKPHTYTKEELAEVLSLLYEEEQSTLISTIVFGLNAPSNSILLQKLQSLLEKSIASSHSINRAKDKGMSRLEYSMQMLISTLRMIITLLH